MNWQMPNFSRSRMNNMINDATKRAVEMNKKSKYYNNSTDNHEKTKTEPEKKPPKEETPETKAAEFNLFNINIDALLHNLLVNFGIDEDKALILAIMFVLYKQEADMSLILALAYILI